MASSSLKIDGSKSSYQRKRLHVFFQIITEHKYTHIVNHFKPLLFKKTWYFLFDPHHVTFTLFHLVADERWQVWVIWPITVVLYTYWVIFKEHAHINRLISKRRHPCLVGLKKYWFQKSKIFQITSIYLDSFWSILRLWPLIFKDKF